MNKIIDKLAYIKIVNGKILSTLSKGNDTYYIPGGKREGNETDEEALIREVKEELSVDLITETIKKYNIFEAQAHGKSEGTIVRMTCYLADYKGKLKASNEIDKIVWLNHKDKNKSSFVDRLIFDDLKEKGLLE